MALHKDITATGRPVCFAHPHSLWERGSNENLARIVREYLLKGIEITHDPTYLSAIAAEINDRPARPTIGVNPARYSSNSSRRMLPPPEPAGEPPAEPWQPKADSEISTATVTCTTWHRPGALPSYPMERLKISDRLELAVNLSEQGRAKREAVRLLRPVRPSGC